MSKVHHTVKPVELHQAKQVLIAHLSAQLNHWALQTITENEPEEYLEKGVRRMCNQIVSLTKI